MENFIFCAVKKTVHVQSQLIILVALFNLLNGCDGASPQKIVHSSQSLAIIAKTLHHSCLIGS